MLKVLKRTLVILIKGIDQGESTAVQLLNKLTYLMETATSVILLVLKFMINNVIAFFTVAKRNTSLKSVWLVCNNDIQSFGMLMVKGFNRAFLAVSGLKNNLYRQIKNV